MNSEKEEGDLAQVTTNVDEVGTKAELSITLMEPAQESPSPGSLNCSMLFVAISCGKICFERTTMVALHLQLRTTRYTRMLVLQKATIPSFRRNKR
jgi:hypothetical protein